jgi:hypothetical protein
MISALRSFVHRLTRAPKRALRQRAERRAAQITGLCRIGETEPEDIFVVGYPKSGNTWMQNLIAGVVFGVDPHVTPDSLVNELVPDVHDRAFYRRYGTPTFFKSHYLPRPEYRRVVYLIRDGRDAMVSYFHHLAALNGSEPDFFQLVSSGVGLFPCRWHEHVDAWTNNPYDADVITIRYESLKADPAGELRRLCQFARLERSEETLQSVARACSFEAMRDREKRMGWSSTVWPRDKAFVRRGEVGSFKSEMPSAVIAEFVRQAEPVLVRSGYPIESI